MLDAEGNWASIETDGQTVEIDPSEPVTIRASLGNLGRATWLAPAEHAGPGGVYLTADADPPITLREPLADDVPWLADARFEATVKITAPTEITLHLTADDRADFGERLTVTLIPAE
ncbi:MAG TPA: hypothetical protein QGH10_14395 [Armatimonadota bacterium]|nr:hypothetical protein [Armatimonadota bacterium]